MDSNADVLAGIGADWRLKVIRIVTECICYGIYLVLIGVFITIARRSSFFSNRSNMFLGVAMALLFCGGTIFLCCDVADLIRRMEIILLENPDETVLKNKLDRADEAVKKLFWTEYILFVYMLSLGDSIVVWRTWQICANRRWLVVVPILTLIGSALAAIFEMGCDLRTHWAMLSIAPAATSVGVRLCMRSDKASFTLSFVTNILCTLLVAYQTWSYRRVMAKYFGIARRKTQVEKVMVLLVESGFIYILLYITQAVPIYGAPMSPTGLIVVNVFNAIIQQAAGIYPTLMIILVKMHKSIWDTDEVSQTLHGRSKFIVTSKDPNLTDVPALTKYRNATGGADATFGREKDIEVNAL